MKSVQATQAKQSLGQVIDDACLDMVMLERHGKEQVALMPATEARMGVLCAYALGIMPRSTAMKRLGLRWYGQLLDAMQAAGMRPLVSAERQQQMAAEAQAVLSQV